MEVTLSPRGRSIVIWLGVIALAVLLLEAAHSLAPFAWATITAYILHPVVSVIHRRTRLPKHLIATWLYLMLGLSIAILVINFAPAIAGQVKGLQDEVPNAVDRVQVWLKENQSSTLSNLGVEEGFFDERLSSFADDFGASVSEFALPVIVGTFAVTIEIIIYLVASFYLIVYGDRFIRSFRRLLHRRYHAEFDRVLHEINHTLGRYIRGQALLVVIMSTASYISLTILDVNYALIVAILTGFLELIPLIGPWAAGAIAVSVAVLQDTAPFGWSNLTLAIVVALTYFALRQMEDAFVIPTVIGRIVHLHPLLVIFVIVVGTSLGGVLGLILAVPIAAVLKILASYLYAKLMTPEKRHIEVIDSREALELFTARIPDHINMNVVLMVEPTVLSWQDLPLVRRIAETAIDHAVSLSAVTPDGVAGTLLTAVGIPTTTFSPASPTALANPA